MKSSTSEARHLTPEARRTGIRIGDPSLVDALEVAYLRNVLDNLPAEWRTGVDVGAGAGNVTASLLARGLRVLAVESDALLAQRLRQRFAGEARDRQFQLEEGNANDRGIALTGTLAAHGFREIGFARVAMEGQEWPGLGPLFVGRSDLPAVVTFRAAGTSAEALLMCIRFLRSRGYGTFDCLVMSGADPVAAERFPGPDLPEVWRACARREVSAAFVAYHSSGAADARLASPRRFLSDYQVLKSQHLLRGALKEEARVATGEGAAAFNAAGLTLSRIRSELRFDILTGGWAGFLARRIGKRLGGKASWSARHENRRSALASSEFGRWLIERVIEPPCGAGAVVAPGVAAGLSVPMTGALHDLMRLHEYADGRLPQRVVELSGGWGLAAYAYASAMPGVAYTIVDYPEALVVQHYFLTLSLPGTSVTFAQSPDVRPTPGSILLVPPSWLKKTSPAALQGHLLFSSRASEELSAVLLVVVRRSREFGVANTYFAGDWTFEGEEMGAMAA